MTTRDETIIRTHVTFTGDDPFIEADDDEDEEADEGNDATFGESVLRRVGERLRRDGLDADEVIEEALGASIEVGTGEETFRMSADHRGDDWHLHVAPLEGDGEREALVSLLRRVDRILKKLSGVRNVLWHTSEDWEAGHEDSAATKPVSEPITGRMRAAS